MQVVNPAINHLHAQCCYAIKKEFNAMSPTPEFLAIGHVARDLHSDGAFSPGGTVTFAALTASRLGLAAGIVTRADPKMSTFLPTFLPSISLHILPSSQTTTFANQYK